MKEYRVGICIEDTIEAEDETEAISKFMESLSWKKCYAIEVESETKSEEWGMTDYKKYINALRKCAKEHDNDRTFTGYIIVSDLCRDTANLLEEIEQKAEDEDKIEWVMINGFILLIIFQK